MITRFKMIAASSLSLAQVNLIHNVDVRVNKRLIQLTADEILT